MNLKQLVRSGFSTRQAQAVLAAAPVPKPSALKIGAVFYDGDGSQSIPAGGQGPVLFDPVRFITGDDWEGPGTTGGSLALTTKSDKTLILYPELDAIYEVYFRVSLYAAQADVGNPFFINITGFDNIAAMTCIVPTTGYIDERGFGVDYVYADAGPQWAGVGILLDGRELTHPLLIDAVELKIVKR